MFSKTKFVTLGRCICFKTKTEQFDYIMISAQIANDLCYVILRAYFRLRRELSPVLPENKTSRACYFRN